MKIKTIIIIVIIIITIIIIAFIMIVITYLIRLFREIRCIQPQSRVSSLIPSLKFLFPLSPRNPYCPLLWNTTLVPWMSIISLFRWKDFPGLADSVDFFLYFTQCVLATGEWCMCFFWFSPQILNERYKQYHEVRSPWVNPCLLI